MYRRALVKEKGQFLVRIKVVNQTNNDDLVSWSMLELDNIGLSWFITVYLGLSLRFDVLLFLMLYVLIFLLLLLLLLVAVVIVII